MKLQLNAELLEEIVQEAVHHVEKRCKNISFVYNSLKI